ncbi:subtilisin-like protein, partial [Conidiobolus coronatus NRRL 28638]
KYNILVVKVLRDYGPGYKSDSIASINWVVNNKSGTNGNVILMGIGRGVSDSQNKTVNDAVDKGFVTIVSSSNDNTGVCNQLSASAKKVITVGPIDVNDKKSSFSNYESCIDINGPESDIKFACIGCKTNACVKSSISMVTPHIVGLAA